METVDRTVLNVQVAFLVDALGHVTVYLRMYLPHLPQSVKGSYLAPCLNSCIRTRGTRRPSPNPQPLSKFQVHISPPPQA